MEKQQLKPFAQNHKLFLFSFHTNKLGKFSNLFLGPLSQQNIRRLRNISLGYWIRLVLRGFAGFGTRELICDSLYQNNL